MEMKWQRNDKEMAQKDMKIPWKCNARKINAIHGKERHVKASSRSDSRSRYRSRFKSWSRSMFRSSLGLVISEGNEREGNTSQGNEMQCKEIQGYTWQVKPWKDMERP
jgi:hypothetical protein